MSRPTRAGQRRRQRQRRTYRVEPVVSTQAGEVEPSARAERASRQPRRPASAGARKPAAARSTPGLDPVAEYRNALGYGRLMRVGLVLALGLLCAEEVLMIRGRSAPSLLGSLSVGLILAFYLTSLIAYFRVVYRVRRNDPSAWRPGPAMVGRMLGVPLGLGDPDARLLDRALLALTALLAVSLLALSFVHKP